MQLVRLAIKNFLSISDAELKPGQINQIVGKNNQGKTTILRALEAALKGTTDGSVVKRGETDAEIILEFDEISIRRRIKSDGKQTVSVKKGDMSANSPQAYLNQLLDGTSLNPLELLDPKKRTEYLLKCIDIRVTPKDLKEVVGDCPVPLPPLEFDQHGLKVAEHAHRFFYQRRAEANKDFQAKQKTWEVKKAELPPLPEFEGSEDELKAAADEVRAEIRRENNKMEHMKVYETRLEKAVKAVAGNRNQQAEARVTISNLEEQLLQARSHLRDLETRELELEKQKDEAESELNVIRPDASHLNALNDRLAGLQADLTARSEARALRARYEAVDTLKADADKARAFAKALDGVVERVGAGFREALMKKAELPVDGLTYEGGAFFLDGFSIDNLSSSKAMKLAVGVARKMASKTKLICIDGAELLDEESYAALREEIDGDGFTYFITKVGEAFQPVRDTDRVIQMKEGQVIQ